MLEAELLRLARDGELGVRGRWRRNGRRSHSRAGRRTGRQQSGNPSRPRHLL